MANDASNIRLQSSSLMYPSVHPQRKPEYQEEPNSEHNEKYHCSPFLLCLFLLVHLHLLPTIVSPCCFFVHHPFLRAFFPLNPPPTLSEPFPIAHIGHGDPYIPSLLF